MATSLSHFDERSGVVQCQTAWGRWWQTAGEVQIEVDRLQDFRSDDKGKSCAGNNDGTRTRAGDIKVDVNPCHIKCQVHGKVVFQGKLYRGVVVDETVWTIRRNADEHDKRVITETLEIQLTKADPYYSDQVWTSLLLDVDDKCAPDLWTLDEMRRKVDLEKLQIEHPGMDFSKATLQKNYN